MSSNSQAKPQQTSKEHATFDGFDFENWTQQLIHQGQKQGFVQLEEISFPITNGPRLSDAKIDEIFRRLNSAGVYVSQGVEPNMTSMGLISVDSAGCLVSLSYACSLRWDDLESTDHSDVRHCLNCMKNVYHIKTGADISIAVENGACVAFFR